MQQNEQKPPEGGNQKISLVRLLQGTRATQVFNLPELASRFKHLYVTFHSVSTPGSLELASKYYEAEKFHFSKILLENEKLQLCSSITIFGCLLDLVVNKLSLDPTLKQCYLVPKGGKCQLRITGYGELAIRKREGQIKDAENPVLVFDGDHFVSGTTIKGERYVEHTQTIPRKSDKAIACYIKICKPDGSHDYKVLTREDLELLRAQSDLPNGPAWTKNYNGMFETKTIKHAFKGYERPRSLGVAKNSVMESEAAEVDPLEEMDIYQFDEPVDISTGKTFAEPPPPDQLQTGGQQAQGAGSNIPEGKQPDLFTAEIPQ